MYFLIIGDLFDAITRVTRFSENQTKIMIKCTMMALKYLHSLSIVHRDIKPENLLVRQFELRVFEFGKMFFNPKKQLLFSVLPNLTKIKILFMKSRN